MEELGADYRKYCIFEFQGAQGRPASLVNKVRMCFGEFGLHCVLIYRLGQLARRITKAHPFFRLPVLFPCFVAEFMMRLIHHVHISGEIGPGFYIGHVGTIYIGAEAIGKNFSVAHNVTIGIGHSNGKVGMPSIGDNVWIGTGSIISGLITIGNNVTIAPGSVVSSNVPDGYLVVGNPARPVQKDYDNSRLFGAETQRAPQQDLAHQGSLPKGVAPCGKPATPESLTAP